MQVYNTFTPAGVVQVEAMNFEVGPSLDPFRRRTPPGTRHPTSVLRLYVDGPESRTFGLVGLFGPGPAEVMFVEKRPSLVSQGASVSLCESLSVSADTVNCIVRPFDELELSGFTRGTNAESAREAQGWTSPEEAAAGLLLGELQVRQAGQFFNQPVELRVPHVRLDTITVQGRVGPSLQDTCCTNLTVEGAEFGALAHGLPLVSVAGVGCEVSWRSSSVLVFRTTAPIAAPVPTEAEVVVSVPGSSARLPVFIEPVACGPGLRRASLSDSTCVPCAAGTASSTLDAALNCPLCRPGTYSGAGVASCVPCGARALSPAGATSSDACFCSPPYGWDGAACVVLPRGASHVERSAPGYWRDPGPANSLDLPALFVACPLSQSCLGDNLCAEGYGGRLCAACADGFTYDGAQCAKAQVSPGGVVFVVLLGASIAAWALRQEPWTTRSYSTAAHHGFHVAQSYVMLTRKGLQVCVDAGPALLLGLDWQLLFQVSRADSAAASLALVFVVLFAVLAVGAQKANLLRDPLALDVAWGNAVGTALRVLAPFLLVQAFVHAAEVDAQPSIWSGVFGVLFFLASSTPILPLVLVKYERRCPVPDEDTDEKAAPTSMRQVFGGLADLPAWQASMVGRRMVFAALVPLRHAWLAAIVVQLLTLGLVHRAYRDTKANASALVAEGSVVILFALALYGEDRHLGPLVVVLVAATLVAHHFGDRGPSGAWVNRISATLREALPEEKEQGLMP